MSDLLFLSKFPFKEIKLCLKKKIHTIIHPDFHINEIGARTNQENEAHMFKLILSVQKIDTF